MKSVLPNKDKERIDYFALFKKATAEAFSFLGTYYGFHIASTFCQMPECAIEYRNETTALVVTYEWESELWVVLKPLKLRSGKVVGGEEIGLDFLIKLRCPERAVRSPGSQRWTNKVIKQRLSHYASVLKECASDILEGDFLIFPEVRKLAKIAKHERDRALYRSKEPKEK